MYEFYYALKCYRTNENLSNERSMTTTTTIIRKATTMYGVHYSKTSEFARHKKDFIE